MIGWEQAVDFTRTHSGRTHPLCGALPRGHVVGIVVAAKFPEPDLIREKIEEGIARVPEDTVWVIRGARKRNDAVSIAWDVLEEHGIEPLCADSNKYWGTSARSWRDNELLLTCERLIVFHDVSSHITEYFIDRSGSIAKVFKIERGKKKPAKRRTGRKPAGV